MLLQETSYITATSTLPQQTTTVVSTLPPSTVVSTYYSTIPPRTFTERATSTLPPETRTIVSTLPQATTTEYSTLPASTVVSTATSTLPAQTSTQVRSYFAPEYCRNFDFARNFQLNSTLSLKLRPEGSLYSLEILMVTFSGHYIHLTSWYHDIGFDLRQYSRGHLY